MIKEKVTSITSSYKAKLMVKEENGIESRTQLFERVQVFKVNDISTLLNLHAQVASSEDKYTQKRRAANKHGYVSKRNKPCRLSAI